MKLKLRFLAGLLGLLAVGVAVYVRASATNNGSAALAPDSSSLSGGACCGPCPESVLPNPYARPATPASVPPKN